MLIEEIVNNRRRATVVKATGLEANTPVGKQVEIIGCPIADRQFGLQLFEGLRSVRQHAARIIGWVQTWVKIVIRWCRSRAVRKSCQNVANPSSADIRRNIIAAVPLLYVISQGQTGGKTRLYLIIDRTEQRINIGFEIIIDQCFGWIAWVRRKALRNYALPCV